MPPSRPKSSIIVMKREEEWGQKPSPIFNYSRCQDINDGAKTHISTPTSRLLSSSWIPKYGLISNQKVLYQNIQTKICKKIMNMHSVAIHLVSNQNLLASQLVTYKHPIVDQSASHSYTHLTNRHSIETPNKVTITHPI